MDRVSRAPSPLVRMAVPLVASVILLGCDGDGDGAADPSQESAGDEATLVIEGFAFVDATVAAGGDVLVENRDSALHTVTGERFDVDVGGGEQVTFTAPEEPGTYDFVCSVHPTMTGTLTVR